MSWPQPLLAGSSCRSAQRDTGQGECLPRCQCSHGVTFSALIFNIRRLDGRSAIRRPIASRAHAQVKERVLARLLDISQQRILCKDGNPISKSHMRAKYPASSPSKVWILGHPSQKLSLLSSQTSIYLNPHTRHTHSQSALLRQPCHTCWFQSSFLVHRLYSGKFIPRCLWHFPGYFLFCPDRPTSSLRVGHDHPGRQWSRVDDGNGVTSNIEWWNSPAASRLCPRTPWFATLATWPLR